MYSFAAFPITVVTQGGIWHVIRWMRNKNQESHYSHTAHFISQFTPVLRHSAENKLQVRHTLVGFEILTAVAMRSTIFWDITPCSPLKVNRRFGRIYRLQLQSFSCHLLPRWFLARLILRPWRWRVYVPLKRRLTFNGLHGVITQKIVLLYILI
jgi:hypothetical protein